MRQLAVVLALASLLPSEAVACGGFFCDAAQPVYQAGEEIVFAVDEDACEVSAHVAIQYEGSADEFAWIVPVGSEPELFPSNSSLFGALRNPTNPVYNVTRETRGACQVPLPQMRAEFNLTGSADEFDDGVSVVGEERVGPYETVTLQALNADVLLQWLQTAGYDLPVELGDVLQPYVADNQYFVALKLASGQDAGDLTPLGMRYAGCGASIPIQLTSVAANPGMPIDVYMLGERRAVPDNYAHVTLNEAAIDWFAGGGNVVDVIGTAADEAGGQAFSTMYSGPVSAGTVFDPSRYSRDLLASRTDAFAFVDELQAQRISISSEVAGVLEDLIVVPQSLIDSGVTPVTYYSCMQCWGDEPDVSQFDSVVAADRIDTLVVPGLIEAQAALDAHPHLTRLTTTMDPEEMTADPVFVFNSDVPQDISNTHTAVDRVNCGLFEGQQGAERKLILDDGRAIKLPSQRWLQRHDTTEFEVTEALHTPAAILIEDLGAEGLGEVVFDYREDAAREARRFDRPGCACTSSPSPVSLGLLGLLLPVVARRRR